MKVVDSVFVRRKDGTPRVDLCQTKVTEFVPTDSVDLLVVAASPDDYRPTSTPLIADLERRGLSLEALSQDKEVDGRDTSACWLSREIDPSFGLNFRHVLCFEPAQRGEPADAVGDIFRGLSPLVADYRLETIALPITAAGDAGVPYQQVLSPMVDAAARWISIGLPVKRILVVIEDLDRARHIQPIFAYVKGELAHLVPPAASQKRDFDVFLSYADENSEAANFFASTLHEVKPTLQIFADRPGLTWGSAWQQDIYENMDSCRRIVALYSPHYLASKTCQEEYNIARCLDRELGGGVLFPIYLWSASLPASMRLPSYLDCREGILILLLGKAAHLLGRRITR